MPPLTQSPLSSPSLRTIAHAQMKSSYFPPVPSAPHAYHGRVPPTPHSSLNIVHHSPQPNLGSPLVGCLKHTQHISGRPQTTAASPLSMSEGGPYHRGDANSHYTHRDQGQAHVQSQGYPQIHTPSANPILRPAMKSINPIEKRRVSTPLKVSQIPLGNPNLRSLHTSASPQARVADHDQTQQYKNQGKRRPSFKIELPPRPNTNTHNNTRGMHQTLSPLPDNPISTNPKHPVTHGSPISQAYEYVESPPIFRDPFENHNATYDYPAGGYMILRAPTKAPLNGNSNSFMDDFPSPTQPLHNHNPMEAEYMYGNEGIGLGYSLNKRVATPWLRSKGDEEEWLKNDDLLAMGLWLGLNVENDGVGVEKKFRSLNIA
ncbi:uncharacterized protein I303_104251 [Kwoniella dejecticola CBS 10117]|uniref:Uncharacterized protein n=1 Tax=Kwoniella dejecticola CBS 10117 TaxID=1296121 RepID=A0A1A6A5V3_9TREE|nr:uncharacterized protein I303_04772 [Kwoniella dejecticola CBS 10117]OBR85437.1 hypothetical protein I303_04772 [Kwoniella dejecticola CBS 10117]